MSDIEPGTVKAPPSIVGDVVFGSMESPVAVCTLASRSLLPALAGRPEIAIAGRVFTENVGIEKMVQNLVAMPSLQYLIVCGRESNHRVGETILALHTAGLDADARVVGSSAPEPFLPNLTAEQLHAFQQRVTLVDLIGEMDAATILARARELAAGEPSPQRSSAQPAPAPVLETIPASPDPADAWVYDPIGFFLIDVDWERQLIRAEQYGQDRTLLRAIEGRSARDVTQTIERLGQVTLLAHAAYLGRELAKAEAALAFGLEYLQDSPLRTRRAERSHGKGD